MDAQIYALIASFLILVRPSTDWHEMSVTNICLKGVPAKGIYSKGFALTMIC